MDAFFASLATPVFWVSVVLVSIVLNVLSAYLKTWMDNVFSRISLVWSKRTKAKREAREQLVANMKFDHQLQIIWLAISNRKHVESVFFLTLGFIAFVTIQFARQIVNSGVPVGADFLEHYHLVRNSIYIASYLAFMMAFGMRVDAQRIEGIVAEASLGKTHF